MVNKMNKFPVLIIFILMLLGCSENKIKNGRMIHSFTFGLFGHDAYQFCNKIDPRFIDKYPSGRNPSRICIRYQYYTCHIKNYCNGEKSCEEDAAQIWTPLWDNARGNLEKRILITKKVCDIEQQNNSSKKP
jgi:hypothetical protein